MSTTILNIDSSIFGKNGVSSQLSEYLIDKLRHQLSDSELVYRSVTEDEIPHFTMQTISNIGNGTATLADTLISEIQKADILVLSAPMYNFAVPSQLKAWFDHIARAGTTFNYTANGPVGLLNNKKAYVVTTRGGIHRDTERDTETSWLATMLGFVGINDIDFIFAEGLNMSEHKEHSIVKAQAQIDDLIQNREPAQ